MTLTRGKVDRVIGRVKICEVLFKIITDYLSRRRGAADLLVDIIEEHVVLAGQVGLLDGGRHPFPASEPHFG